MTRIARRTAAVALATVAITMGAVGAANASAPGGSETCPSNTFCLYYNSWQYGWGSFAEYPPGTPGPLTFNVYGNGSGYGQSVIDNASAIVNNTGEYWEMCTADRNHCEYYAPGEAGNVSPDIHNQDAMLFEAGIRYL